MKLKDICTLKEKLRQTWTVYSSRDITLPTKVHIIKAMVFQVVMYGCESWTIKKAEHQRMDAFKLWCWWRCLRVPWTTTRSKQSILKKSTMNIHWKDWCWNSNTLATWCEELTHWKRPWCWGRLKVGGEWDDRGWDGWMLSLTQWTWVWASSRSWWWTGEAWRSAVHGVTKNWTQLSDFTYIVVLGKTLESSLDSKEIKPINPKGNQLWIGIGRTDAEAEIPTGWPQCEEPTH